MPVFVKVHAIYHKQNLNHLISNIPVLTSNSIDFSLVVVDVLMTCRQSENPDSNMRVDCFDFVNGTFVRRPSDNCQVMT